MENSNLNESSNKNENIIELDENKIENLDNANSSITNANANTNTSDDETVSNLKKKLKHTKIFNIVLILLLVGLMIIFLCLSVSAFILYKRSKPLFRSLFSNAVNIASISQIENEKQLDLQKLTNKLAFFDDCVNMFYHYDKDNKKVEDGLFTGYVKALGDRYAEYFPAKEFEEFTEKTTEGVYYGIGCVVNQDSKTKDCIINTVYEGSPAEKGGLKVGDIFVKVDGENVRGIALEKIVEKIKGEEGTKREITVFRPSENKEIDLVCYTGKVDIKLISSKILEDDIGYIDIDEFTGKAVSQFKKAVDDLVDKNVKGLIIDCRSNPGGELLTICEMLDYLVRDKDGRYTLNQKEEVFKPGKTLLVYIKEKGKIVDEAYAEDNHSVELPMVVLTDNNTASAAELFTQTLRDYKKAKIVGIKTFGKGVVQNIIPYEDGSAIKFTVSEYFPPSGYAIDQVGIIPDYSLNSSGEEVIYDKNNHIVVYDDNTKYVFDRDGAIIEETKIDVAIDSDAVLITSEISHKENLKVYDDQNMFLDEDWYIDLDCKYEDKQLLQALVVLRNELSYK